MNKWRVAEVKDHGASVTARAANGAGEIEARGRYLVGADGARSLVRQTLGLQYEGESGVQRDFMGGQMHAIYMKAPGLYKLINGPKAWMYWAFNGDRRGFLATVDGRTEFVYHTQLKANEERQRISEPEARAMFAQSMGCAADFDIISRSSWTAGYTLVANAMGRGRMFLTGDAAHLFTPTGGLGYNTAIEDAANLGWKLAAAVKGWAGPDLLSSYELERRPNAMRNMRYARGFADSVGLYRPSPEIEAATPAGERARAEAGRYLEAHARSEFNIPGITFGIRYDGSPVIVRDGTEPPPDRANEYVPTACPGGRAPHLWLDDGRSLYDAFGFDFTLLRLGTGADGGPFERAAAARGMPLTCLDLAGTGARDLYEADLALVRPDQMVAWRGNAGADAGAILDRVTGRA